MPAPTVVSEFLELVRKSRLLTSSELFIATDDYNLDSISSVEDAAKALMKGRYLTRFQAKRLLEGRHRGFFVDNFKILEVLGVGGMGWVYLAEDKKTGERVALKMLSKKNEVDPGMIARFKLEGLAGLKVNHPNLVRTHKMEETDAIYGSALFVAMEFFKGVSLDELVILRDQALLPHHACDLMLQAALGLEHAHGIGMVHRDIKPSNLLIDHEGQLKILDFGLSLIDKSDDEFSLAMVFGQDCLGTADYIAPEQAMDSFNVDGRADIYSLGCTFYVALTGKLPFPFKTGAEKIKARMKMKAKPIRQHSPHVPAKIEAIVEKMMKRQPENRFQTATEVAAVLKPFARREAVEFDFQALLIARTTDVSKRIAALQSTARRTAAATKLSSLTRDSSTAIQENFIADDDTAIRTQKPQ